MSLQGGWRLSVTHPHPAALEVISQRTCWFPFPHPAPQSNAQTPREGPSCRGCVAGGMGAVFQQCFRIINIPSLGQRDVPSPEPLVLIKDSWGQAGQQEQALFWLLQQHIFLAANHPWSCSNASAAPTCPREQPLPTSLPALAEEAAQLPLKLSPTLLRLL